MSFLARGAETLNLLGVIAVIWSVAIASMDVAQRRVPNALTFGAMLLAVIAFFWTGLSPLGAGGASMLIGATLSLVLTLPGYLTHKLGAGDVKLLLAIALLGGTAAVLTSFVVGTLTIVVVAVCWVWLGPGFGFSYPGGKSLPFGAALALGFVVAVIRGHVGDVPWPY